MVTGAKLKLHRRDIARLVCIFFCDMLCQSDVLNVSPSAVHGFSYLCFGRRGAVNHPLQETRLGQAAQHRLLLWSPRHS